MKKKIHPKYMETTVSCGCGESFKTRSTKPAITVEICSKCHPFYTGKQKFVDSAGQVEKFQKKFGWTEVKAVEVSERKEPKKPPKTPRSPKRKTLSAKPKEDAPPSKKPKGKEKVEAKASAPVAKSAESAPPPKEEPKS